MSRVLVTGGSGFIGAVLVRRLLADGHEVHVLLRRQHSPWRLDGVRDGLHPHEADVDDAQSLAAAVASARADHVFHLAAYGAYPSQADPHRAARTNLLGTVDLLEACAERGFESFVHAGTSSEYGPKDHAPGEDEMVDPISAYATTKAAATLYCQYVGKRDGSRVVTLRLYSAYGPFEEPTRLFPALILAGLEGRLPPLAHPDLAHDYVHVDDICDAFISASLRAPSGGAIYNVASGTQTTLRNVVDVARRTLGIRAEPAWGSFPDRPWDRSVWVGNAGKIRQELGWVPRLALAEGFRSTVDWLTGDATLLERYRSATSADAVRRV
jgi:nucleoside-diphosphate-sugar epimerase